MSPTGEEIRRVLLEVINDYSNKEGGSFQSETILGDAQRRLGINNNLKIEQALLTLWHEEAIQLWIDTAKEFGDPIPEPKGNKLIYA